MYDPWDLASPYRFQNYSHGYHMDDGPHNIYFGYYIFDNGDSYTRPGADLLDPKGCTGSRLEIVFLVKFQLFTIYAPPKKMFFLSWCTGRHPGVICSSSATALGSNVDKEVQLLLIGMLLSYYCRCWFITLMAASSAQPFHYGWIFYWTILVGIHKYVVWYLCHFLVVAFRRIQDRVFEEKS